LDDAGEFEIDFGKGAIVGNFLRECEELAMLI
jgi:hypothetical protein